MCDNGVGSALIFYSRFAGVFAQHNNHKEHPDDKAEETMMPKVKVGDINIYYEEHGRGEPLALVMGYSGSSEWWFRQVPALSREYRVITFDNRGTGQTDKPDIPYAMEMMTADLAGLLDAIGVRATHMFGVSMGGMIAQHFALNYPQRVISLILGCTNCGGPHSVIPEPEAISALLDLGKIDQMTLEQRASAVLPFIFTREFIENNGGIILDFGFAMMAHPTPSHVYMRHMQAIAGHDTYDRLPRIKAPTLVIAGDADRLIPVENSRILASRIPDAELSILKNVGHGFNVEAEAEANRAVLDFLRRHRRAR